MDTVAFLNGYKVNIGDSGKKESVYIILEVRLNTRVWILEKLLLIYLKKIEYEDLYVNDILHNALRRMQFSDKRDRAFLTRLVEGVTERRISLDFFIDKFSKKGKKKA